MAKATLKLPNGTTVTIEGTTEEVQKLLALCGGSPATKDGAKTGTSKQTGKKTTSQRAKKPEIDHVEIVNLVKTCDEAEAIEEHILDQASQVNRTLLPIYIVHEYLGNAYGLTSGDIHAITKDLGIPISTPNASRTMSGTASRYLISDKSRKKGRTIRYELHRRGVEYMKSVIAGRKSDG